MNERQKGIALEPPDGPEPKRRVSRLAGRLRTLQLSFGAFGILLMVYDLGFIHAERLQPYFHLVYDLILMFVVITQLGLGRSGFYARHRSALVYSIQALEIVAVLVVGAELVRFFGTGDALPLRILTAPETARLTIILFLVLELAVTPLNFSRIKISAPILFIVSFLLIILIGTALLMLPKATPDGDLSFTDAFFTATSAVCVTGLIVRDTGTQFTFFGQWVILALIQTGGLGIMTFTSFFSYFFRRDASFNDQLILKYLTNSDTLGDVFATLRRIVLLTFSFEAVGALLYFVQLEGPWPERLYFSVFHSISAFCNAGFSTLPNGLATGDFTYRYGLHWVAASLLIFGGLGFPIILNVVQYWRQFLRRTTARRRHMPLLPTPPRFLDLNTRLVLITTAILLVGGCLLMLLSEWNGVLAGRSLYGKITTAFFAGATPRTAGFNTIDMPALGLPAVIVTMFLMWIGASPGSTGGGIKTSTFAVASLAVWNTARDRDRMEIAGRTVTTGSINRAFAAVLLSIVIIGTGFFMLSFTESADPKLLIFECISAYSTVGLSLNFTSQLSEVGRWVIIALMFIGRVGILTMLVSSYRPSRTYAYRLPEESILIN